MTLSSALRIPDLGQRPSGHHQGRVPPDDHWPGVHDPADHLLDPGGRLGTNLSAPATVVLPALW